VVEIFDIVGTIVSEWLTDRFDARFLLLARYNTVRGPVSNRLRGEGAHRLRLGVRLAPDRGGGSRSGGSRDP